MCHGISDLDQVQALMGSKHEHQAMLGNHGFTIIEKQDLDL